MTTNNSLLQVLPDPGLLAFSARQRLSRQFGQFFGGQGRVGEMKFRIFGEFRGYLNADHRGVFF